MRTWLTLCCCLALSCGDPRLQPAEDAFELDPASLDLGPVWLGGQRSRSLTLRNLAKFPRAVTLQAQGPFSTAPELSLSPLEAAPLAVTFRPTELGPVEGELTLSSEGQTLRARLTGEGIEPIACPTPAPCQRFEADPATSSCIPSPLPDGTACSTACIAEGTCVSGSCLGATLSCDDQNACTLDVCDHSVGCGHLDVSADCPAAEDPCQAASCDPLTGCRVTDVPDGTPCGESDCLTAQVCLQGACETRTPPEGAPCGEATPCQPRGICRDQACVQPPPSTMSPVWTYQPAAGVGVVFPGVADSAGNLFWLESDPLGAAELVSATREGALRFRQSIPELPLMSYDRNGIALIADSVVAIAWVTVRGGPGILQARRATDGALLWARGLTDLGPALGVSASTAGFWFIGVVEGANGDLVANVRSNAGGAAWSSWAVALDRATGALRWSARYTYLSRLIADAQGNLYGYDELFEHRVLSLDSQGQERWNLVVGTSDKPGAAPPVLVLDELLLTAYPTTHRAASTGAVLSTSTLPSTSVFDVPPTLASATELIVPDPNSVCSTAIGGWLTNWKPTWSWSDRSSCLADPILTARGSVLFRSASRASGAVTLRELDSSGAALYECQLPFAPVKGASVLHEGRWIALMGSPAQIAAFDLPGVALAPHGWVSSWGNQARNQRPR